MSNVREIPIPVKQVIQVEVVFDAKTRDDTEKDFLKKNAIHFLKSCWPTFTEALGQVDQQISFVTRFPSSEADDIKTTNEEMIRLSANLVKQQQAITATIRSGEQRYYQFEVRLFLYVKPPQREITIMVVDPDHRVIPQW